ncbi:ethanolamine kinase 1 [Neodiprion pinetum]|uniref:ethanolamine kinase 1 n=2 Tax=Neodiprion TaxID=270857 RepID=UPI001ED8E84E|nr:ethanolamine kinase 1 isoform X1 [Neodiprion fabricii]XP_046432546.1 ethanolamine kinase 1 isoform X1 [Neodiprion fabricii]XP_046432547.1 ethanolamine kinase 1 isoform X1 [Neodiprion fabricii]XP_046432548.1 ethanolamine kinase 1 isoform X1 [Neodiprion fabricii]XP_046432549.1 ethanolamine kinase 1 isoform X1 [Neodiprion fabricii]XP_046432550.1 ethanolamine kinase 1 isoform X1 [Neodiprion fabricii]XP_046487392.1 ethanolamine kinase 1 isoform X1 [Neodiprion pinetum]XP_046487393.1 ethanolamin
MAEVHKEPHFDIVIDGDKLNEGAAEIVKLLRPAWSIDDYQFKLFTNGISNKLVGVWCKDRYDEMVLIRVYGYKTDLFIDRTAETRNIRLMHAAGYTHCLYATFNNGLAYEFLPGDTLTVDSVRSPPIYKLVAKRLAEMHKLNPTHPEISTEPFIWDKIEKFMRIMPKSFSNKEKQAKFRRIIQPYTELEKQYQLLKNELSKLDNVVVFAHNDLLLGNVLHNAKENTVTFIDYEYSAYNYQAYDIANHFAEFVGLDVPDYSLYPDETLQRDWLRLYLEEYNGTPDVTENEIKKLYIHVNKFLLLSHFFWGCWSLIQSEHSLIGFDFLEYASIRFNELFKKKDQLFVSE